MQRCQVSEVARGLEAPWTQATSAIFFTPIKIENVAWSNVAKGSPGANKATWDRGSVYMHSKGVAILRLIPTMTTVQEVQQKVPTKVASVRRHMLASGCSYKKAARKAS